MMAQLELEFEGDPAVLEAYANNVSYGGMGLYCRKPLPVGQEVWAKIDFINARTQQQWEAIAGTIRWCRPAGFWFAAGLDVKRHDRDEHGVLISFLEQTEHLRLYF